MAFQDLMDGVDHLVEQKIADPNRLGIGSWSNGGFMTEYAFTHTTRYAHQLDVQKRVMAWFDKYLKR